jgi:hypothetical protein
VGIAQDHQGDLCSAEGLPVPLYGGGVGKGDRRIKTGAENRPQKRFIGTLFFILLSLLLIPHRIICILNFNDLSL